ncbi:MAG: prolipoprotein diacylglyceryl transferase [Bacteroidales bacterium]|jgi:prolipoprotein diacylglyceryl transferase|nr:prolipoprotein diacylglyceryl transferase [Bacteroidales bacterium]
MSLPGFIIWDIDPEIFSVGVFSVRWYGLLFAAAFVLGYFIIRKMFRKEHVPLKVLNHLTWYIAIGTIVGARLGHCLFYEPDYYFQHPWEIFMIWYGGLASHGAAVGILTALYIFSRVEHKPFLWILDKIVVVVALSGFLIRIGNLLNSEIYGMETSLPWGFIFVRTNEILAKHPTQIYEALSYLLIFILLYYLYFKKPTVMYQGVLSGIFLVLTFSVRFLIEFIKEDQVAFEKGMVLNMGQMLSIPLIIWGIYLLTRPKKIFAGKMPDKIEETSN